MQSRFAVPVVLLLLAALLSACGPQPASAGASPTQAPAAQIPASTASSPYVMPANTQSAATSTEPESGTAHVALGKSGQYGGFLVDDKGMALYLYTKDTPGTSNCYGKCAVAWPPLLTSGAPLGSEGLDANKFGTTTRADGTTQVTFNGWPLYYFAKDKQPGDTTGQNVGSVWYLVSPSGDAIK